MTSTNTPILFVQESFTKISTDQYTNSLIHNPHITYTTLLNGTDTKHGVRKGLGVFIRNTHSTLPTIKTLHSTPPNDFFSCVELSLKHNNLFYNMIVFNVYTPQSKREFTSILRLLHDTITSLSPTHKYILVGGDFNMRGHMNGDNVLCCKYEIFQNLHFPLLITNSTLPHPQCPNFSRQQNDSHSTLDYIMCNNSLHPSLSSFIIHNPCLIPSDHFPVSITLHIPSLTPNHQRTHTKPTVLLPWRRTIPSTAPLNIIPWNAVDVAPNDVDAISESLNSNVILNLSTNHFIRPSSNTLSSTQLISIPPSSNYFTIIKTTSTPPQPHSISLLQFDGASVTGADHSAWGMVIFGSLPTSADYAAVGGLPRPTLYESGVYKSGLSSLEAIYSGLADGLRVALQRGISALLLECDYRILVLQLLDRDLLRQPQLCKLRNDIILLIDKFSFVAIRHIFQRFNSVAKGLTLQAIMTQANVSSCRQHDCLFKFPIIQQQSSTKTTYSSFIYNRYITLLDKSITSLRINKRSCITTSVLEQLYNNFFMYHNTSFDFSLTTSSSINDIVKFRRRLIRHYSRLEKCRLHNILNTLTPSSKHFHNTLNTIIGKIPSSDISTVVVAGNVIDDQQTVANTIAQHFSHAATPVPINLAAVDTIRSFGKDISPRPLWVPPEVDDWRPAIVDKKTNMSRHFTADEILITASSRLNIHSASGDDGIPPRLLLKLCQHDTFASNIATLFNSILDKRLTPSDWSSAYWRAIPKSSSSHIVNNLRPLSIGHAIAKLFELCILRRIEKHLQSRLSSLQFGFVHKRSTLIAYTVLLDSILLRAKQNLSTRVILVDIEKAFDTVCIDLLLHKLHSHDVDTAIVDIIGSILKQMSRYTQHKGYKSPVYKILAGVSQGSVLAPLLYIVFIDDIVDFFRKRGRYISITTATTIATLLFADDLALPTGINDTGTQQLLDDLRLYAAASRFRVNIIKTVIMDAPVPSLTPLPPPSPFFLSPPAGPNNSYLPVQLPLSTVSSVRYLGIELGGTPAFLITHVKKKIQACSASLVPYLNAFYSRQLTFHPTFIHNIVIPTCFSVLEYGHQCVFPFLSPQLLSKLSSFCRSAVRSLLGIHKRNGQDTIHYIKSGEVRLLFPISNVILQMDVLLPPLEWRWFINSCKHYNNMLFLANTSIAELHDLMTSSLKLGSGWLHNFRKLMLRFCSGLPPTLVGTDFIPLPLIRQHLRLYFWSRIKTEVNSKSHLHHLLPLPPDDSLLPWERPLPAYFNHMVSHNSDAIRAVIAFRSGLILQHCQCGASSPSISHLLWHCPLLSSIKSSFLSLINNNHIFNNNNNPINTIMSILTEGGEHLLHTIHYVHKAYLLQLP